LKRRAFSLIELLIVVMIMGVVYTLAVTKFQTVADEAKRVSLGTLKIYLQKIPHEKSVKFICLDDCSSCKVIADGKVIEKLNNSFDGFLDDSVRVYRYDISSGAQEITKEIYFNSEDVEESVCFSYTVDKKGIGDQVFVEFKDRVYDYTSYFSPIPVYDSVQDVVDAKENEVQEVIR
jgi:prepilin-type N-terminal cleavage/methylation domain-containing protein